MFKSISLTSKTLRFMVLSLSLTTLVGSFASVEARPDKYYRSAPPGWERKNEVNQNRKNPTYYSANLNSGTVIPTTLPSAKKILVTKDETLPVTLVVTRDVKDNSGRVVIPRGSEVVGEVRPAGSGSRFVGNTVILPNGEQYSIQANSKIVTRTEKISDGRNTDAIWQGALAGSAAATLISAVTGDKAIATEEVLGGAGFGALAGFLFGGTRDRELISINTQEDLDLTVTSNISW
ncbi:hypothetical protein [Cyanobacterium aponinum]|uniref:S-layer domain-containing protein n=1 Tax=Cyanobacterium aponinum 0216 TaxID=2676140 RepID=A0A844GN59_9CHRO|nr:hypothetical protein [Cyanobacterium aponinum]MTF38034.1 hypothetical protein [Cyanobacterium aponinum 0216]